jgi:hypothetical protein
MIFATPAFTANGQVVVPPILFVIRRAPDDRFAEHLGEMANDLCTTSRQAVMQGLAEPAPTAALGVKVRELLQRLINWIPE